MTPGCCIVPVWGAVKAPVCSFGSAFRTLRQRGALFPPLHPSPPALPRGRRRWSCGPRAGGAAGPRPLPWLSHLPQQPPLPFGTPLAGLSVWLLAVLNVFSKRACIVPNRFSLRAVDRLKLLKTSIRCCVVSVLKISWHLQIFVY